MHGNLTALVVTSLVILIVVLIGFLAGRNKKVRGSVEEWSLEEEGLAVCLSGFW